MSVLQHFYTSFLNPTTGEGGFRTKAVSPGLGPEALSNILRLISYRIPPTLDERAPDTHPVALRFCPLDATDGVISCVRSCGSDENGRPGNVFAHSLILPLEELRDIHPAWLWEHQNWRSADPSTTDTLPILPPFDWSEALKGPAVWDFVHGEARLDLFSRLLSVIVSCDRPGGRRVVIVDGPNQVALWVAGLSKALPASLRSLLTFSTYHHDPYQSAWLITGTSRDSTMRLASQDFLQYFVVDVETGRTSDQEPSCYAQLVVSHLGAAGPDDELSAFLSFCDRRVRVNPRLDGSLDRLASAYELLGRSNWAGATVSELELLGGLADDMASATGKDPEQLPDLVFVLSAVRAAVMASKNSQLLESYRRAAMVARRHDPAFENYLDEEIEIVAVMAIERNAEARPLLKDLVDAYGEHPVRTVLIGAACLGRLSSVADNGPSLVLLWNCFGGLLFPRQTSHAVFESTLQCIDIAVSTDTHAIHPDADALTKSLLSAAAGLEKELLEMALRWRREHGGAGADLLYYGVVRDLSLDRRRQWRDLVQKEVDDIAEYEIECDVRRAGQGAASVLTQWADNLSGDNPKRAVILAAGLRRAWADVPESLQQSLARDLLGRDGLTESLDPQWETTLVQMAFAERTFDWVIREPIDFLHRFVDHPALLPRDAALLEMRMAIDRRQFDERKRVQVHERLAGLSSSSQYAKEIERLLPPFISPAVSLNDYSALLTAAYVAQYSAAFWKVHKDAITKLVVDLPSAPMMRVPFLSRPTQDIDRAVDELATWMSTLLAFWFGSASNGLLDFPYLSQQFFMELPGTFASLQRCAQWKQLAHVIAARSNKEPWFPMIDTWLVNAQIR